MPSLDFSVILTDMQAHGLYNNMKIVDSPQGAYLTVGGKNYLNLCSNNYLGFAADERLKKAAISAIEKMGVGTASVRALIGTNTLHEELERKLAELKGTEDAVAVTSGYLANMAAIQTLMGKEDVVISDELNHASIIDAVRVAGVKNKFIYKHANVDDLRAQLPAVREVLDTPKEDGGKRNAMIITDGVFSMDGDLAPLPELVDVATSLDAWLMVDDAHGEGVLGAGGRGIVDHFGLHGKVAIEVGTLSKAFGVVGGFVAGNKDVISFLRQKARQFLFTNALSIPDTAALIAAVDILIASDEPVKKLWENTEYLQSELQKAGFDIGGTATPLTPVMLGDENVAKTFATRLYEEGALVSAIKFPMVPLGKARLRLIPSAVHTMDDLAKGVEKIIAVGKELGIRL